jgi:hypothetical protein
MMVQLSTDHPHYTDIVNTILSFLIDILTVKRVRQCENTLMSIVGCLDTDPFASSSQSTPMSDSFANLGFVRLPWPSMQITFVTDQISQ